MLNNSVYIPYKLVYRFIIFVSIASAVVLIALDYDMVYKWAILLPIAFLLSTVIFLKGYAVNGLGSIALVGVYTFRMCFLPVFCAYGNFYIEPQGDIHLPYFALAILLMCFECFIVFASLNIYSRKYNRLYEQCENNRISKTNNSIIYLFVIGSVAVYTIIVLLHPRFLFNHYHLLIASYEDAVKFEYGNVTLQSLGAPYYLAVILDLTARPVASFALVNKALEKNKKSGIAIAIMIGIFNVLWMSDRRIISLLVGMCCLLQVLIHIRSKLTKYMLYWMVALSSVLTVVYCFIGEDTPLRVARKFQRYFSGPSLTAIGFAVYTNYFQTPLNFLKLLFNDSILLTGLFGNVPVRGYVIELCGEAGESIWTPMFIGSIQYFHFFAPLVIICVVKFIVYTDYRARKEKSDLQKMMLNYLTIAVSVYMVMYSVELVYYNIIFIGGFFYLLLEINRRVLLVYSGRRNING